MGRDRLWWLSRSRFRQGRHALGHRIEFGDCRLQLVRTLLGSLHVVDGPRISWLGSSGGTCSLLGTWFRLRRLCHGLGGDPWSREICRRGRSGRRWEWCREGFGLRGWFRLGDGCFGLRGRFRLGDGFMVSEQLCGSGGSGGSGGNVHREKWLRAFRFSWRWWRGDSSCAWGWGQRGDSSCAWGWGRRGDCSWGWGWWSRRGDSGWRWGWGERGDCSCGWGDCSWR